MELGVSEKDSSGAEARFFLFLLSELKLRPPKERRNPRHRQECLWHRLASLVMEKVWVRSGGWRHGYKGYGVVGSNAVEDGAEEFGYGVSGWETNG